MATISGEMSGYISPSAPPNGEAVPFAQQLDLRSSRRARPQSLKTCVGGCEDGVEDPGGDPVEEGVLDLLAPFAFIPGLLDVEDGVAGMARDHTEEVTWSVGWQYKIKLFHIVSI